MNIGLFIMPAKLDVSNLGNEPPLPLSPAPYNTIITTTIITIIIAIIILVALMILNCSCIQHCLALIQQPMKQTIMLLLLAHQLVITFL